MSLLSDAVVAAEVLPAVDDKWDRYESPNFELYSHNGDKESRAILHDLELLRAVFMDHFKMIERDRLEVTVYSFRRNRDMKAYSPHAAGQTKQIAGLYLARPDRAVIMVGPSSASSNAQQVIFHEYIHHLFKAVGINPPLWYNEGMAEVLAGVKVQRDKVMFGQPMMEHVAWLQQGKLIPLDEFFAVTHDSVYYQSQNHAGLFYAQSWALLHFWMHGSSGIDPKGVSRFLKTVTDSEAMNSTTPRALFEECFQMNYGDMQSLLGRYLRRGKYSYGGIPIPEILPVTSYEKSPVSAETMRLRLAELAVRVQGGAAGKYVLLNATAAPTVEPRVWEVLGSDAFVTGDIDSAASYWDRAVEAGSNNSAVLRQLAQLEWGKWFNRFNYDLKLPVAVENRFRELLVRSIQQEPEQEASYEMLIWLETFANTPVIQNVNDVQRRFPKLKDKNRTLLGLALFRARHDDPEDAIKLIRVLRTAKLDEWTTSAVEVSLARLEGRPVPE